MWKLAVMLLTVVGCRGYETTGEEQQTLRKLSEISAFAFNEFGPETGVALDKFRRINLLIGALEAKNYPFRIKEDMTKDAWGQEFVFGRSKDGPTIVSKASRAGGEPEEDNDIFAVFIMHRGKVISVEIRYPSKKIQRTYDGSQWKPTR